MRTCGEMTPANSLTQHCDRFLIMGKMEEVITANHNLAEV